MPLVISAYILSEFKFSDYSAVLKIDYPVGASRGLYIMSYHQNRLSAFVDACQHIENSLNTRGVKCTCRFIRECLFLLEDTTQ